MSTVEPGYINKKRSQKYRSKIKKFNFG